MSPGEADERDVTDALVPLVYDELRDIARSFFRKQPASFTLHPTDIVDEACLHLLRHSKVQWESAEHFRAIATKKIWQVIVDHLRTRHAQKRGGVPATPDTSTDAGAVPSGVAQPKRKRRVPLDGVNVAWRDRTVDVLDLAEALEDLGTESRRLREVVMLHWFGGLKYAEIAKLYALSESTIEKDFHYALAWLNRRLGGAGRGD